MGDESIRRVLSLYELGVLLGQSLGREGPGRAASLGDLRLEVPDARLHLLQRQFVREHGDLGHHPAVECALVFALDGQRHRPQRRVLLDDLGTAERKRPVEQAAIHRSVDHERHQVVHP